MDVDLRQKLDTQMAFLLEADKLKLVDRSNSIGDGSRPENSAEHSWHVALMAIVLAEHCAEPISLGRVLELLTLHDLVEVYAGDTVIYDEEATVGQADREEQAAKRLFGLLPEGQGERLRQGWREFEEGTTPEARFARAVDALAPTWLHWGQHSQPEPCLVAEHEVLRCKVGRLGAYPSLWNYLVDFVRLATERGLLKEEMIPPQSEPGAV